MGSTTNLTDVVASSIDATTIDADSLDTAALEIGSVAQTQAAKLNSNGLEKHVKVSVNAAAGGSAQTAAICTVPLGSVITEVVAVVKTAFNGDTTKTFEVGVAANTDKYVDPSDFDPGGSAGTYKAMTGGTNNDQKSSEYCAAATAIIATWTNTANASAGAVDVIVSYIDLA